VNAVLFSRNRHDDDGGGDNDDGRGDGGRDH
jgi:hypothetical protein